MQKIQQIWANQTKEGKYNAGPLIMHWAIEQGFQQKGCCITFLGPKSRKKRTKLVQSLHELWSLCVISGSLILDVAQNLCAC